MRNLLATNVLRNDNLTIFFFFFENPTSDNFLAFNQSLFCDSVPLLNAEGESTGNVNLAEK